MIRDRDAKFTAAFDTRRVVLAEHVAKHGRIVTVRQRRIQGTGRKSQVGL